MTTKDKYKKVAYYPGCALEGTEHAYNRSTKAVGKELGLYHILEYISAGGMSTVYKAYQPSMDRYVALKVLSTHLTQKIMHFIRWIIPYFRLLDRAVAALFMAPARLLRAHPPSPAGVPRLPRGGAKHLIRVPNATPRRPAAAA